MELSSYHAIVACAASGTGIAIMPRSVLETMRSGRNLSVHALSGGAGKLTTCLVWRKGEVSLALNALKLQLAGAEEVERKHARGKRPPASARRKSTQKNA